MPITAIKFIKKEGKFKHQLLLTDKKTNWNQTGLSKENQIAVKKSIKQNTKSIVLTENGNYVFINYNDGKASYQSNETWRKGGSQIVALSNGYQLDALTILNYSQEKKNLAYALEGALLGNYEFGKYWTRKSSRGKSLRTINVLEGSIDKKSLTSVSQICEATCIARDLVNEPLSFLTAEQLSTEIKKIGKSAGFKVEVFNKAKIKAQKMGGLIAVNLGSPNPPTFNILEWKPKNAKHKKPMVLVGKGVVYDTGGLSLKPTPHSMDMMKCDMGGAATVIGTLYAVAKAKLPIHVIGLIPATENRPGGNAYTPGDVIKMHSGLTVEVLNTDAEGRMVLADALSYAKKYKPELVIDVATLTGAAARAIGPEGIVYMGTAQDKVKQNIEQSGKDVYERLVEFPLWEEYNNYIKSDIADIKNIGGAAGGAITAGMFLKNFIDYPWLHLDIAGVAFLDSDMGYRLKNGTGVGVRLLVDFIQKQYC